MASAASAASVRGTDVLSVHFDVILRVAIERLKQFGEADCKGIIVSVIRFLGVAGGVDGFCGEGGHSTADFSSALHVELAVLFERSEQVSEDSGTGIS